MSDDLGRIFLEAEGKLVGESRQLKASFDETYDNDYDASLKTVQRMLEVFSDLKTLKDHRDAFLGALESRKKIEAAVDGLQKHLEAIAAPLGEMRSNLKALRELDMDALRTLLERHAGKEELLIELPDELDPLLVRLSSLFPDLLGEDGAQLQASVPEPAPTPVLAPVVEPDPEPEPQPRAGSQ